MAKIEPANLLLTDKDGNTGLVKSLTNKDITTLKGVVTNVDYIKDYMNTNNITLPVQGDIHLTATDEEGNNGKTLLGTSSGILQWDNQNLVRSVNGVNADAQCNVQGYYPSYDTFINIPVPETATGESLIPYTVQYNGLLVLGCTSNGTGSHIRIFTST